RRRLVERIDGLRAPNLIPWSLRAASCLIGPRTTVGVGTCMAPGAILTTDARIGDHCIVNVRASVSHDSVIGSYTNLNPGVTVCGNVRIGEGCYIGAGAT